MVFWQKILTTAGCVAMCLPLQSLESCCCSISCELDSLAAKSCCSLLGRSKQNVDHQVARIQTIKTGCCGKKASAGKASSSCCSSARCRGKSATRFVDEAGEAQSKTSDAATEADEACGVDCPCDCSCLSAPSNVARISEARDVSFDFVGVAGSVSKFAITYEPSFVVSFYERPPIAHNRRQSQLCVWLN